MSDIDIHARLDYITESLIEHMKQEKIDRDAFIASLTNNTKMIKEHAAKTESILEAWNAIMITGRVLTKIGNGIKWLAGFAAVGSAITYFSNHTN